MSRRVVEHGQRVERIAHVGPEVARVLLLPPGIADLHRGVVRVDDVRSQHHADGQGVQGLEEFGRLEPPAVHRLPRDADALPLEDPFQPVQGQMVGALAHDHLRHQPRTGQTRRESPRPACGPPPRSAPRASGRSPAVAPCGRISCGHGRSTNSVEGRQSSCSLRSGGNSTRFSAPPMAAFSASERS